jgi:hypothetical protein
MDTEAVMESLVTLMERLARDLSVCEGARIIFLPPLVANLSLGAASFRKHDLDGTVRAAARYRLLRRAAVRFTYPKRGKQRRGWLVMHDRVHRTLRGCIANLAVSTGAVVVAGTVVLDTPRIHWEDWPDGGHLFHSTWCFGPDGEPFDMARHPAPNWNVLNGVHVDKAPSAGRNFLKTPVGEVGIHWDDVPCGEMQTPLIWAPRAWTGGDLSSTGTHEDRFPKEAGVEALLPERQGRGVAVRSCLVGMLGETLEGSSFVATRGTDGMADARYAPSALTNRGVSWIELNVKFPWQ